NGYQHRVLFSFDDFLFSNCFDVLLNLGDTKLWDRNLSPEMNASLCSQFMFLWIIPLIFKGFRSTLTMNNIFELPDFLKTEKIIEICNISSNSIFMSLCFSSWKELLVQFIFAMIWTFVYSIVPPYFLEKILQYIQNYSDINEGTQAIGYLYVFFLFVGTVIPDLCFQQASYIGQQLSVKYRQAVIIDKIYQTTMFLNGDEKNKGMITDLMDSDAQKVSSLTRNFFYNLMTATDKRVGLLGELLQAVRIVKLYVMEDYFRIKITDARDDELKKLNNYMIKRTGVRTLWTILTFLMMLLSFFCHTKILGNTLTSSVAFTAFILFKNLRHILDELPSILVSIIQARVSISRIKKFLREFENYRKNFKNNHENSYIIGFGNATLQWSNNDGHTADGLNIFTWINLNVRFPYGKLSLIYGPTGCGKTGLLKALLGEIKCIDGHVFSPKFGEVAYSAQTENILFGFEYDAEKFSKVLRMCVLENEVLKFGDKEIGENGNTLSNGQRQRIALARAIYSQHEVLILDDFLSAVDLHITNYIYEQCLTSDLMENRTRILVTHNKDLCRGAAMTVFMKDGKIETIDEIDGLTNELLKHETLEDEMLENDSISSRNNNKLIKEEKKAEGMVKFKVYKTYILTSGLLIWILIAVIFVAARYMQTVQGENFTFWSSRILDDAHNDKWADAYETNDSTYKASYQCALSKVVEDLNFIAGNFILTQTPFFSPNNYTLNYHPTFYQLDNIDYYLWVYAFAGLATILLATCRTYCIFHGSLKASKELHNILLNKILSTTIRFYDTTPIACILIATLYIIIGVLYIYASRDLKRLESVSRSPIYTAFADTIAGISTIRAFGAEERLRKIMWSLIDDNNRPSILNWACNQWLHTHASLAGGLFGLAIGAIIIHDLSPKTSSGLAGLILAYTVSFSRNIIDIITAYTVMEMNMNAVHEYLMLEEEQKISENPSPPPGEWLTNGDIQVINLEVGYSPNDPPVLKGISFYVRPREKIGIIGRTGSGKSTLLESFIRFLNPTSGQIIIDGIDISTINLFDLRSKLTVIPQNPILFSGSLRDNIGYGTNHCDIEFYEALRKVHVIESSTYISQRNSDENIKLLTPDTVVDEGGNNFSQGQSQLIALARACVNKSKVVLMDEATASIDYDTGSKIEKIIREEFKDSTLLYITHRLEAIIEYDKILVLDDGSIVEFDQPYILLEKLDSKFRKTCMASGEFEKLYEKAKFNYLRNHVSDHNS
ncbi:34871_t:CDS:10, partial [Gigaspora margarita]